METNNKTTLITCGALLVGILVGWAVSSGGGDRYGMKSGMHRMPDGKMMHDMDSKMHSNMSMGDMMASMTANLQGKTGADFDKAFLTEMIPHHQGAVEMAKMVLNSSKNSELIKLANEIIAAQNKEISMMKAWQKVWFGVSN